MSAGGPAEMRVCASFWRELAGASGQAVRSLREGARRRGTRRTRAGEQAPDSPAAGLIADAVGKPGGKARLPLPSPEDGGVSGRIWKSRVMHLRADICTVSHSRWCAPWHGSFSHERPCPNEACPLTRFTNVRQLLASTFFEGTSVVTSASRKGSMAARHTGRLSRKAVCQALGTMQRREFPVI